jgi:E1-E2 ATPase
MLLQVETTATAEGSTVARLGRTVEAAAAQRSPLEGAVARFAKYYTPVVLVAALLIAFVPWATNSSKSHKVLPLTLHVAFCPLTAAHSPACVAPSCMHCTRLWYFVKPRLQTAPNTKKTHSGSRDMAACTAAASHDELTAEFCGECSTGCTWRCRSW